MYQKFYTVTDQDTQYTNPFSTRFSTIEEAIQDAKNRISRHTPATQVPVRGVFVMEAIKFVGQIPPPTPPIEVIDLK